MSQNLDGNIIKFLIEAQRNELTEYYVYKRLSERVKDKNNSGVLSKIADDEMTHYNFLTGVTGEKPKHKIFKMWKFYFISRLFGLTFGIKLMENGEVGAQVGYEKLVGVIAGMEKLVEDENTHEKMLIDMIEEERLKYVGSMVLGLNDALVELTGTLAGLTFALQDTMLIAKVGLITGIAASLSMAASEYLSQKADDGEDSPLKSSLYTGTAYVGTVVFLIVPFFIFTNHLVALGATLGNAVVIIFIFNFYISVANELNFWKRFLEMTVISMGVAAISFGIGALVRSVMGA